ncbi:unnamed protein product [Nezara viridula]|uniref:Uncharacterized protein n=1 Tax=Nezara viridula TaxID=85310 RepID=A0A9P0GYN6_NEZVI|nr:unnamed protein product [Nezara viridula]
MIDSGYSPLGYFLSTKSRTSALSLTPRAAIIHGKCLNIEEVEFERLRASRKNWACPNCQKTHKNPLSDKQPSTPKVATQQTAVDHTSQLQLTAIKDLMAEVKEL